MLPKGTTSLDARAAAVGVAQITRSFLLSQHALVNSTAQALGSLLYPELAADEADAGPVGEVPPA